MKHFYVAASFLLLAVVFVSCKKKDKDADPLKRFTGTWEIVAERGVNGYRVYAPGEGARTMFKSDYTYFRHLPGIADEEGNFKLTRVDAKPELDAPAYDLIIFGSSYTNSYVFLKDTLVLSPYSLNPGTPNYQIWETKLVRVP